MTYTVTTEQIDSKLFAVHVEVLDGAGNVVLTGDTKVVTHDATVANDYGERVFLPDLRTNCEEIASLVFPWEEAL